MGMKFGIVIGVVAAVGIKSAGKPAKEIPDVLGDKNSATPEGTWEEYQNNRPHDNDCSINESNNWYGNHMCKFSWECRGATMCELHSYGDPGTGGIGWCRGWDGCEGSPLPLEAPGLGTTHAQKKN